MSDTAIANAIAERGKVEAKIAESEARTKRLKAQLAEINNFILQWEKFSGKQAPSSPSRNLSHNDTDSDREEVVGNSPKEEVAAAAKAILSGAKAPMPRSDLYKRLVLHGLRINGKNPEMVLSTMLWRAGNDAGIVRLASGGYWLKEKLGPDDKVSENASS